MIAFVVGLIFIVIHPDSYQASLIAQLTVTGIYAVMLLSHMIANESTADSIERYEMEIRYVKDASSKLKGIMDSISDKKLQKKWRKYMICSIPVRLNLTILSAIMNYRF